MSQFDINNNGYLEVNEQLLRHVNNVGEIINEINGALAGISAATDSKATPIWLELQRNWNAAYEEMKTKLNVSTMSSINVHQIFTDGDNAGARIMMS
ncbi:WXG100 family type VII secretion target [Lentzea sp. E54]|uniref:WXG100 family type VII secretion target n=1 Tax=Lentzea xerophila TaxID=3435883 RepID=UPI003DA2503D